jgi:hypothetical protein
VLVQEDFNAIGRMNGGQQPPPVSAANCKNPYVDGEIPLPGSPVVQGVSGGGIGGGGSTPTTGAAGGTGAGGSSKSGSKSGSGSGGKSGSGGSSRAARERAAGLTPELAAQGYTVVDGQVVRKLGVGGPNQFERANALVTATNAVGTTRFAVYAGWALLVLGLILVPPLVAMRINRRRAAATVDLQGED